ncbi:hypothetical protein Tco_0686565 [Tanacetum coccineum]
MVAYLEKTDGNTEFHQIMDFLTRSSIYYALTVSPIVSTSFVEQFWTIVKSRTVQKLSLYRSTVAACTVTISEASIRSDLLFDDADGIDSLNNQAIFDNIQLMSNQLKDGKNFSGKVTPLFDSMLVQQTKDEGEASERPSDSQPIPSPPHQSDGLTQTQTKPFSRPSPSIHSFSDSNPEGSGGNHGGQSSSDRSLSGNEDGMALQSVYDLCISLCTQVSAQAREIKVLKAQVKKLKKGVTLNTHHKAWMKSVALKTRLARNTSLKKRGVQKEYVSKQGRKYVKSSKGEPSVHKDPAFDDLDDDAMDYMETEDAQDEGRTSSVVLEEKESADRKQDGGTDCIKVSTDRQGEGTADQNEGKSATQTAPTTTSTPTPTIFGDDETIAQVLITMEKVSEEWEAEEEKKRLAEEEATKVALTNEYDFIQARINADKILVEELQKEEREKEGYQEIQGKKDTAKMETVLKACRVCILELKDGTVIYMLVERRYPLSKKLLQQMLDLGLEVEEESLTSPKANGIGISQSQMATWVKGISNPVNGCNTIQHFKGDRTWKGVVRFGERGKFSLCYIGPFKILARVGPVAYTLELPEELKGIHNTFHISNLKKRLVEGDVVVPMDEIQLDDKLHMIEEPVEVVDREVKRLKQSRIPIVRVR